MWHGHPSDEIDVTIAPFVPILNHLESLGTKIYYRHIPNNIVPKNEDWQQLDAIEEVVFIGYPNGLWDDVNILPISRRGTTATHPAVDFQGKKQFLVDASVFPGSSGSPVFLYNNSGTYRNKAGGAVVGTRIMFLGVIAAVLLRQSRNEIQLVPVPTKQIPIVITNEMIDLGVVFKSITVKETVEKFLTDNNLA